MYRRAFILTFDRDEPLDFKSLHNEIVNVPSVITWSHYIKSSYILIVNTNSATDLNKQLMEVLSIKRFLIIEVNLKNRNGRMPREAWEWFRNQVGRIF